MKRLLLFLMILFMIAPAPVHSQQVTTLTQTTPQKTVMATLYAAGSYAFQISPGITNHQLTYVAAPSITALTVTMTMSTDGSTYGTACGSATTTVGSATITCSGSYVSGKVALTLVTGSGPFDATYYGQTTVANVFGFPKYFADGTAALPSISFASDTAKGFYSSGAARIGWASGGLIKGAFGTSLYLNATTPISWTSGAVEATGVDTNILRGGVGILYASNASGTSNNEVSWGDVSHTLKDVFLNGNAGGNATTGAVGEYVSSSITSGALVNLATGSATTITSITLTAGDWDVTGVVDYRLNAATSLTVLKQGSALATGIFGAQDSSTAFEQAAAIPLSTVDMAWEIPMFRYSVSAPTVVYLTAQANFSVNTAQAYGTIRARRIR